MLVSYLTVVQEERSHPHSAASSNQSQILASIVVFHSLDDDVSPYFHDTSRDRLNQYQAVAVHDRISHDVLQVAVPYSKESFIYTRM